MKRYDANVFFPGCLGPLNREVVLADDAAKLEAEAQALREEVAALRARVVVPDEYAEFEAWLEREKPAGCIGDMERGWMQRARLNGKAVSEGLLRRIAEYGDDFGKAWEELRALLGEGKEPDRDPAG